MAPMSPGKGERWLRHMREEQGPAWRMSRGGPPKRNRVVGVPPGIRNGDPGLQARLGAMGSHPSRRPGGASRIACTPPGLKQVTRVSAASTPGAFRFIARDRKAQAPDSLTSHPMV